MNISRSTVHVNVHTILSQNNTVQFNLLHWKMAFIMYTLCVATCTFSTEAHLAKCCADTVRFGKLDPSTSVVDYLQSNKIIIMKIITMKDMQNESMIIWQYHATARSWNTIQYRLCLTIFERENHLLIS